jgi:hypothetical protein
VPVAGWETRPNKRLFIYTPPGMEQIIADQAEPARPSEPVPGQDDEEWLRRFPIIAELDQWIMLPDPE